MASTSAAVAVKKEKKSKLWSTPPYPGNEQNTKHAGKESKRQSTREGSSSRPFDGSSDHHDSDLGGFGDFGPEASNKPAPKPPSQNIVPAASPVSDRSTQHTHRMVTVNAKGWYMHPSKEAISTRMNCLYPGFHVIMAGTKSTDAKGIVSTHRSSTSHASHVKRVWNIVTAVDAELRAKEMATSQPHMDINKSSSFGVRMHYLINLYAATKEVHSAGQVAQSATANSDDSTQKNGLPSHEEMMAYRILTPRYEFPHFAINILRGTEFEYLLYPLAPPGNVIKDANAKSAPELSRMKKKIAELEARLEDADNRLKQADNKLSQQHQAFEAEREREGDAVRRRHDGLFLQLKAHETCRANVKDMILNMQRTASKAANMHNQHLSSLQDLLDQVSQSREEEKVDKKGLQQGESSEGDTSEGETSEEESSEEEDDDEEDQRPAKIRRIS